MTAEKWASWVSGIKEDCVNIFIDYETFGEHQWEETGIFTFLRELPGEVLEIDVGDFSTISWADMERDTSAWLGNDMQRRCFEEIKLLEPFVRKTGDSEILRI